jgi:DedD protein
VDRHLKERMIGAIVLVAAAIILIPEMLSGPRSPAVASPTESSLSPASGSSADGGKFKTYTIDLARAATSSAAAEAPRSGNTETTSDPVKHVVATPPSPTTESPPAVDVASVERRPSAEEVKPAPAVQQTPSVQHAKPEESATARPGAAKSPPTRVATTDSGWAVQVGSFGVRATSDRLANELKQAGFPAYVIAFQAGNQTMYRVRIGPARDRAAAEGLLNKVKSQHPTATLVPSS